MLVIALWEWSATIISAYRLRNRSRPPAASTSSSSPRSAPATAPDHVPAAVLGGVGLVQVEEQEVEPVAGHEPAADVAAVAVDAGADVERRAGVVGEEQVAQEVPPRPVHRIGDAHPAGEPAGRRAG